jgi:dTDP-D-glucose 4,6-dehydratase
MKILVTGGCGFLGSNLAAGALRRNCDLVVLDNMSRFGSEKNLAWLRSQGEFCFRHGDMRNVYDVDRVIGEEKPDVVFHLAGQVAMTTSIAHPRVDFETNAMGTFNLLDAVRRLRPETAILYSSTNKVYGDLEWVDYVEGEARYTDPLRPNGLTENTPLDFQSPYGCSKGAADQYILDFARAFGLKTIVFRHSSMYGARQFGTFDQGWISWFCQQALLTAAGKLEKPFTIAGNGKQVRDVLEADDMERLYFAGLEHIEAARGHVFNIGGGMENSLSLLELLSLLEEMVGSKLAFTKLAPRYSDQKIFVADTSKAKRLLNWTPEVSSRTGIARMVQWIKEQKG